MGETNPMPRNKDNGGDGWNKNHLPESSIMCPNAKKPKNVKNEARVFFGNEININMRKKKATSNEPMRLKMENGRSKILGNMLWANTMAQISKFENKFT